jgi:hypothetical protein
LHLTFTPYLHLISQVTSPSPPSMPGAAAKTNSSTNNPPHHSQYYITGADLIVCVCEFPIKYHVVALSEAGSQQVEDTLFRIHRYFLTRDSAYFRRQLPHPSPGDSLKGSSDNNPLVLENTLKVDFERFLWVFYNPYVFVHNFLASSNCRVGNTPFTMPVLRSGHPF